jgi:hypothetical protein
MEGIEDMEQISHYRRVFLETTLGKVDCLRREAEEENRMLMSRKRLLATIMRIRMQDQLRSAWYSSGYGGYKRTLKVLRTGQFWASGLPDSEIRKRVEKEKERALLKA